MSTTELISLGIIGVAGLCLLVVLAPLLLLHLRSRSAGVSVEMMELVGMRLRRVDARKVVAARIEAARAGLSISTNSLEIHALAGGDIDRVVAAMIEARTRGLSWTFNEAAAYDLAGRDVLAEVRAGRPPGDAEPGQPDRAR